MIQLNGCPSKILLKNKINAKINIDTKFSVNSPGNFCGDVWIV